MFSFYMYKNFEIINILLYINEKRFIGDLKKMSKIN